jgi:hypothetical protein
MYIETLASGRPRPILNERGEREMDNRKNYQTQDNNIKKPESPETKAAVKKFS